MNSHDARTKHETLKITEKRTYHIRINSISWSNS